MRETISESFVNSLRYWVSFAIALDLSLWASRRNLYNVLQFLRPIFLFDASETILKLNKWRPVLLRRNSRPVRRYSRFQRKIVAVKTKRHCCYPISESECPLIQNAEQNITRLNVLSYKKFILGKHHLSVPHYGFSKQLKRAVSSSKGGHLTLQLFDIRLSGALAFGLPPKTLRAIYVQGLRAHAHIKRVSGQTV